MSEYVPVSDVPNVVSDIGKNFRLLNKGREGRYEHVSHPHSFQPCSSKVSFFYFLCLWGDVSIFEMQTKRKSCGLRENCYPNAK